MNNYVHIVMHVGMQMRMAAIGEYWRSARMHTHSFIVSQQAWCSARRSRCRRRRSDSQPQAKSRT